MCIKKTSIISSYLTIFSILTLLSGCGGGGGGGSAKDEGVNSVSGTIVSNSNALQNVSVTLVGPVSFTTKTDAYGNYGFTDLGNGEYTITPTLEGYEFTPLNQTIIINNHNLTVNNFTFAILPTSSLYFNPNAISVNVGQDFNLDAMINPSTFKVNAAELHIIYDQTKLSLNSVTTSSDFSLTLYAPPIPSPQDGTASIYCSPPLGLTATTTTKIATFSFHALVAVTKSSVMFTTTSLAAASGENGNVISIRTPASVTVNP